MLCSRKFIAQRYWRIPELPKDMVPKKIFFTGVGKHRERLTSFELALRDGIAAQNLVRVSSDFSATMQAGAALAGTEIFKSG
jgi:arginine decarboxylase